MLKFYKIDDLKYFTDYAVAWRGSIQSKDRQRCTCCCVPGYSSWLGAEEVAKMLGITREHVYALMDKGLPTLKLGRTRRILSDDLDTWLKEQKEIRNSRQL